MRGHPWGNSRLTRRVQISHRVWLIRPRTSTCPPHTTQSRVSVSLIKGTRRFHYPWLPWVTFPCLTTERLSATRLREAEHQGQQTGPGDCSRSTHHGPHDLALSDAQTAAAMTTTTTMTMGMTVDGPPNRLMTSHSRVLVRTLSRRGSSRVPSTKQTLTNTLAALRSSCTGFATSSNIFAAVTFRSSTATAAWPSSSTTKLFTATLACPLILPVHLRNTSRPANWRFSPQRIDFPKNNS